MPKRNLEVAIVGAGMSGMLMGIRLLEAGIRSFRIYEKAARVGGTWRENTYPGLTCDVPSYYYSYSFAPKVDWSHRFSPGAEIQEYFEGVANEQGILPYIAFDTEIVSARYGGGKWHLETSTGERSTADVFVMAAGPLHVKQYPDIPGLDSFAGACFHTADWQHDVPLEGKRIGVIGNGSTGVQMMEPLSEVASHLTMFQRTAQWIMPIGNREFTEVQRARARRFPFLARIWRAVWRNLFDRFSVGVTEDGAARRQISKRCRAHLETVKDPVLRQKLTPDYEPGCKRLIMSTNFYPTLQKPNVELVTEPIERIEPRGVVTRDGALHELHVLVTATGFDPRAWGVEHVVGAEGKSLKEAWAAGTRTYRSVTMPGFPNFFMLVGPNSPIGNLSIIDVSETQSAYIMRCIERLRAGEALALCPKDEAARAFNERVREAMRGTVWATGCKSWYLDEKGESLTWPWSAQRFRREMRTPRFDDFEHLVA